jgi:hypothetical protein
MKFAPLSQTGPGDLVADHTALATGATGAISSEQYDILLRATTTLKQDASVYSTNVVFVVIPIYLPIGKASPSRLTSETAKNERLRLSRLRRPSQDHER